MKKYILIRRRISNKTILAYVLKLIGSPCHACGSRHPVNPDVQDLVTMRKTSLDSRFRRNDILTYVLMITTDAIFLIQKSASLSYITSHNVLKYDIDDRETRYE
jgi:hypothetical protein